MIEIYNNDVLDFLKHSHNRFNFALYDPPYEIAITGNKWDNSDIVFNPIYNQRLFNAMMPGAFVVCYGHARVFHRVMVALENSGFIVHKSIMAWAYSSGQPQGAPNITKNFDTKMASQYGGFCSCENTEDHQESKGYIANRFQEVAENIAICNECDRPKRKIIEEIKWGKTSGKKTIGGRGYGNNNTQIIAEPLSHEAKLFQDYSYGLSSIKPMVEPIIIVQKPFENNDAVSTISKYGTGVVNVHDTTYSTRWPGNFVAIHDIGCYKDNDGKWSCTPYCELHQEYLRDNTFYEKYVTVAYGEADEAIDRVDKFVVVSKPNKNERHASGENPHPTVKPIALNEYLGKLFLPPSEYSEATVFSPFSGSGSEMIGLSNAGWNNIIGIEQSSEYATYAKNRVEHFTGRDCGLYVFSDSV